MSRAGEHAALWLAAGAAGAALDRRHRSAWLAGLVTVAGAHAAAVGMKQVVRRPRPEPPGPEGTARVALMSGLSFPSAHASSSAAAVLAFAGLLPRSLTVPLAATTCASRVVLSAHYPSDVLAGAMLGATVGGLARRWMRGRR